MVVPPEASAHCTLVVAKPPKVVVMQGEEALFQVKVQLILSQAPIELSTLSNLPPDVSISFEPRVLRFVEDFPGGENRTLLRLTTSTATPPGTYTLVVIATAQRPSPCDDYDTVSLVVEPRPQPRREPDIRHAYPWPVYVMAPVNVALLIAFLFLSVFSHYHRASGLDRAKTAPHRLKRQGP